MPDKVKKLPKLRWLVLAGVVLLLALQFGSYALFAEQKFVESIKANVLFAFTRDYNKKPEEKSVDWGLLLIQGYDGYVLDRRYHAEIADFMLKYSKNPFLEGENAQTFAKVDESNGGCWFFLQSETDSTRITYHVSSGDFPIFSRQVTVERKKLYPPSADFFHQIWLFGNWHTYKEYLVP